MSTYFQFLFLGLGNGGVYAALAVALVVTYRSSGVLNFATGAQALYAAYTYSLLRNGQLLQPIPGLSATINLGTGLGFWPALLITLAISAVMGALAYLLIFRPLRNHRPVAKAVASIGLMGLLTAIVTYQAGTSVLLVNPIFPQNHVSFLGVDISVDRLLLAATIIGIGVVAHGPVPIHPLRVSDSGLSRDRGGRTRQRTLPRAHRVDELDHQLRRLRVGRRPHRTARAIAARDVHTVHRSRPGRCRGRTLSLPGVGHHGGARYRRARVTLGLSQRRLPQLPCGCRPAHPIGPCARSAGRSRSNHAQPGHAGPSHARARARPHWRLATTIVSLAVGIAAIYLFTGNDRAALYSSMITAIIALSLVVVTGYTGQISLAQLTFAGVSAYILSTFASSWGIPFPIAPILAALVAAAAGVVIGIPALRVRGLMLGVVTLTFAAGVEAIWFNNNSIDGGASGLAIPTPRLFGMDLGIGSGKDFPRPAFGIMCLVVLVLVAFGISWLRTSRLGTAMLAVRADERSAAAAGINVVKVKLIGFAIAAFIAGLGGSLLAYQLGNVTFQDFDAYLGLVVFSVVVVAGITSVSGGILAGVISSGGILVALISSGVGSGGVDNWYGIVAGVSVILTVIFNPDGVVGPTHLFLEQRRVRGVMARPEGALVPTLATPTETDVSVAPGHSARACVSRGRRIGRDRSRSRNQRARTTVSKRKRRNPARHQKPDGPLRRRHRSGQRQLHRGGRGDHGVDRPERRRQDDHHRRPLRLPRVRGLGHRGSAGRRRLRTPPAGRHGARPHLPARGRLRRHDRRGKRTGGTAQDRR